LIGLSFHRHLLLRIQVLDCKIGYRHTGGVKKDQQQETKFYSKKEYKAKKESEKEVSAAQEMDETDQAVLCIKALGGKENIGCSDELCDKTESQRV
jgi:PTS system arbutin-like IIC component